MNGTHDPSACPICGTENCDNPSHQTPPPRDRRGGAAAEPPPRLARWAADVMKDPPPEEIIEGVAWAGLLTVMAAESSAGKTFVALDMSAAVSAGLPWHRRTTKQGTVAYCSYEGDAIGKRLRAARDYRGHRFEHLSIIRLSEPISPRVGYDGETHSLGEMTLVREIEQLQAEIKAKHLPPLVLIVIDTVRASMTGSEDSSEPVSAYIRVARRVLALAPGAAGLLAHHAGWQDSETPKKRERGSSAWRGNVDATIFLEAGPYDREHGTADLVLRTLKVRDDEPPVPLHVIRRRVALNESDRRGQPVTSCIIESDPRTHAEIEAANDEAVAAQKREIDRQILQLALDRPDLATSKDSLREALAGKRERVHDSIGRLLLAGWLQRPSKQRQPYVVTAAGRAALRNPETGESAPVGPSHPPVVPTDSDRVSESAPPFRADSLTLKQSGPVGPELTKGPTRRPVPKKAAKRTQQESSSRKTPKTRARSNT